MYRYLKKFYKLTDTNKLEFFYILFLSSIVCLMDVVGVLSILPLVWLITDFEHFKSIASEYDFKILNSLLDLPLSNIIIIFSLISIILFILKILSSIYAQYILNKFAYKKMYFLRGKILKKIVNLDYEVFQNLNKNEILNILLTTVQEFIELSLRPILRIFSELIIVILFSTILIFTDFKITILILSFLSILSLTYYFLIRKKIYNYGSISDSENMKTIESASNNINGFIDLKILNLRDKFLNIFFSHIKNFSDTKTKSVLFEMLPRSLFELTIFLILNFLIILYTLTGNINFIVQNLAMFAIISVRLLPSLSIIASSSVAIRFSNSHLNKLYFFISELKILKSNQNINKENKTFNFSSLDIKNLEFKYDDSFIFKNLNLSIKKNDFICLTGDSGSGKSTLIKILCQIIKPSNGKILLNNEDFNNFDIKNNICLITQNHFLINGSIKENITLSFDDTKKNDNKILEILKEVNLLDEITNSGRNIHSSISQDGSELSGGQKQRLIIARSLYFNRELFIFDEATSSLDKNNTESVVKTLLKLKNKITLIFITHNLEHIKFCDKIYQLTSSGLINYKE
jgi:ATP-binding cassette, subfamily B, bacterial PglK